MVFDYRVRYIGVVDVQFVVRGGQRDFYFVKAVVFGSSFGKLML